MNGGNRMNGNGSSFRAKRRNHQLIKTTANAGNVSHTHQHTQLPSHGITENLSKIELNDTTTYDSNENMLAGEVSKNINENNDEKDIENDAIERPHKRQKTQGLLVFFFWNLFFVCYFCYFFFFYCLCVYFWSMVLFRNRCHDLCVSTQNK